MHSSEARGRATSRRALLGQMGTAVALGLAGCITAEENAVVEGDQAVDLIASGFDAAGIDPPFETTIYANSENDERVRWAQVVQHELNETGLFEVGFERLEWGQYQELIFSMADREENALATLNVSGGWDPHSYVEPLFHSANHAPDGLNFNHFESATVDELIETGRRSDDLTQRREIYADLVEELVRLAPISILRYGETVTVYRRDAVTDWREYPLPGSEYECVYAPYAGTAVSAVDGDELVGDAIADVTNPDPIRMFDTTSNMATSLLYEGLVGVDFEGTPRPQLATDWDRLDETTYRFELREDVRFHNGESLTADHVRFSFERYEGSPREADVYEWFDGIDVLDDRELEIHLAEPYGPFETSVGIPIVPLGVADGDVDLSVAPVGTGPYQFGGHEPGEYWLLERFDDHWAGNGGEDVSAGADGAEDVDGSDAVPASPPIESIRLRVLTRGAARQAALETGEIDVATGLPTESVAAFADDDAYGVERTVAGQFDFLIYPSYLSPFDRVEVRRGIDRLLPRERIVEDVYAGIGSAAYTPLPPLLESYVDPEVEAYIADEYFG